MKAFLFPIMNETRIIPKQSKTIVEFLKKGSRIIFKYSYSCEDGKRKFSLLRGANSWYSIEMIERDFWESLDPLAFDWDKQKNPEWQSHADHFPSPVTYLTVRIHLIHLQLVVFISLRKILENASKLGLTQANPENNVPN